jgi:mono/diheme cytochrome c family protein
MMKVFMDRRFSIFGLVLVLVLALAACGGDGGGGTTDTESEGEATEGEAAGEGEATEGEGEAAGGEGEAAAGGVSAERGEELFNQQLIANQAAGCVTCHYVDPARGDFTGPNLAGIATVAGERVEGQSAEEYLRTSIVNTNEYIAEGFSAGVMPANYGDILTEDEIDSLVAYLMTLDGPRAE